jgi:hypothetical protein
MPFTENPIYHFKLTPEFLWTLLLFALVTVGTAFYGQTGNVADWGGAEWKAMAVGLIPTLGRAVVAFVLTAITGVKFGDGFSK